MHANWEKITPQDVGSVLGFTEQLLLSKFSVVREANPSLNADAHRDTSV